MGGRYRPRFNEKTGEWKQRKLTHLDAQFIGRALEHAGQFVSKWSIAVKYAGVAKKDSAKYHEAQYRKRHHAITEIRNMNGAARDLGEALSKGRYRKAVDIAKSILMTRLPWPAEYDQPHGKWDPPPD